MPSRVHMPLKAEAPEPFELFQGCTLPAGRYDVWVRATPNEGSTPKFDMKLTRDQLRDFGQFMARDDEPTTVDVTPHVTGGNLVILD